MDPVVMWETADGYSPLVSFLNQQQEGPAIPIGKPQAQPLKTGSFYAPALLPQPVSWPMAM